MEQYDKRVDDYIRKSADFAKPILIHLRQLVHLTSPELNETMKWSSPFFDFQGPVCQMAAFKQHCAFGFWKAALMPDPYRLLNQQPDTAGSFGRITSLADLPGDDILIEYITQAVLLNAKGIKTLSSVKTRADRVDGKVPDYFNQQLALHPAAEQNFEKFSPSQKKEYVSWLEDAKTDTTRLKRLETAIEWISEGKSRHWKYK